MSKRVNRLWRGSRPYVRMAAIAMALIVPAAQAQVVGPARAEGAASAQPAPAKPPEGSVGGMGDVNLYPRRIVIDRRQRIATVGLYNKTPDDGEYEISVIDMVMTPDGQVHRVDDLPPGVSADRLRPSSSMLRWSPRRVMLRGSEAQTVRIMARPPADLPDGEYRAHFMVVSVPGDMDEGFSIEDTAGRGGAGKNIGVTIRPRFGISIPVILRVGETTLDVGLDGLALVDTPNGKAVSVTISRSGTRSAYGDIIVTAPGSGHPVALARGVGVYPEVDARQLALPVSKEFDPSLLKPGTSLTVTYVDDDVVPGETLARREFVVR